MSHLKKSYMPMWLVKYCWC